MRTGNQRWNYVGTVQEFWESISPIARIRWIVEKIFGVDYFEDTETNLYCKQLYNKQLYNKYFF